MQVTTDLQDMFNYSTIPAIITLLWLIAFIVLLIIVSKVYNKKEIVIVQPPKKDRNTIKNNYLTLINELVIKYNENKISKRLAYQKLSKIIRDFIFEMTSIKVQYYTLSDIEKINLPVLYELVSDYYSPEFSYLGDGNFANSIEKTRQVILKWN